MSWITGQGHLRRFDEAIARFVDGNFNRHFFRVFFSAQTDGASASHEISHMRRRYSALSTGLKSVCACARFHGSRWRQRPGHHTKPRNMRLHACNYTHFRAFVCKVRGHCVKCACSTRALHAYNAAIPLNGSLLAEALFLLFADGRKETSAMGREWLWFNRRRQSWTALLKRMLLALFADHNLSPLRLAHLFTRIPLSFIEPTL